MYYTFYHKLININYAFSAENYLIRPLYQIIGFNVKNNNSTFFMCFSNHRLANVALFKLFLLANLKDVYSNIRFLISTLYEFLNHTQLLKSGPIN